MIPEAAVEAAAVIAELRLFNHHKAADFIEAAAPHMMARAYNAGHLDGVNGSPNANPYS